MNCGECLRYLEQSCEGDRLTRPLPAEVRPVPPLSLTWHPEVELHLRECPDCQRILDNDARLEDAVTLWNVAVPAVSLVEQVMDQLAGMAITSHEEEPPAAAGNVEHQEDAETVNPWRAAPAPFFSSPPRVSAVPVRNHRVTSAASSQHVSTLVTEGVVHGTEEAPFASSKSPRLRVESDRRHSPYRRWICFWGGSVATLISLMMLFGKERNPASPPLTDHSAPMRVTAPPSPERHIPHAATPTFGPLQPGAASSTSLVATSPATRTPPGFMTSLASGSVAGPVMWSSMEWALGMGVFADRPATYQLLADTAWLTMVDWVVPEIPGRQMMAQPIVMPPEHDLASGVWDDWVEHLKPYRDSVGETLDLFRLTALPPET